MGGLQLVAPRLRCLVACGILVAQQEIEAVSPTEPVSPDFPGGVDGKASAYNVGDLGLIPGSEVPGRRKWQPTPYSCLENPMDGRPWCPWDHKESDTTE